MFCKNCRKKLSEESVFCEFCGTKVEQNHFESNMENQQPQENKPTKLDKAVKISIVAGVLIVALSIAFYFVYFLPNKDMHRENVRKECASWAIDKAIVKAGRDDKKYAVDDYNNYFERCLREKGL